jgi:flagellar hook-associated protein 1 FlgK
VSLQLSTYREEVSGVSMDEEMVNMVQFQSAYNAAAKLVSTVDELLEALIAMV